MEQEENSLNTDEKKHADIKPRPEVSDDKIDELRERLYSRGSAAAGSTRHSLVEERVPERRETKQMPQGVENQEIRTPLQTSSQAQIKREIVDEPENEVLYSEDMPKKSKRSSFRKALTIFGLVFFVIAVSIASVFLFWGNNTISGNNISIKVNGPVSIGGGEELSYQVSIANQNAVPIQSATLFVEYPRGTKSAEEKGNELTLETVQLDTIGSGELVNIPLKAVMYGEEDEEKEIKVRIEYRVDGSNATFEKKATPLILRVSTSPLVLSFDAIESISSGQEFDLRLSVQSNSPTTLSNILLKASYPIGFDYSTSDPDTVSGEDTWNIEELKPNEKYTITIKGLLTGGENDVRTFDVTAGVAAERDPNTLVSQLANARTEVLIEQPFIDIDVTVNGSSKEDVVVSEKDRVQFAVSVTNTLETAIYDSRILIELDGNALNEFSVQDSSGFYDSISNTITWDSAENASLREILPGDSAKIQFSLTPKRNVGNAPELTIKTTFTGERRVFSSDASQKLEGIASRVIKIESVPEIESEILYGKGPFTNTGPVPPVAETVTQYTYKVSVEAGVNDITDAEVVAILPQYVNWLDLSQGDGTVSYNSTTRTMKWSVGDIDSKDTETMYVQVSMTPSLSQVGSTPTLLNTQRFSGTDRFTGTLLRISGPALTTSLLNESDEDLEDGKVRRPE